MGDPITDAEYRQLDVRIANEYFGYEVEWRWCLGDVDGWHEVESLYDGQIGYTQADLKDEIAFYKGTYKLDACYRKGRLWNIVPYYSTSDKDALLVWNHLRGTGKWCCLQIDSDHDICYTIRLTPYNLYRPHKPTVIIDEGNNSLAWNICMAALESIQPDKGVVKAYEKVKDAK